MNPYLTALRPRQWTKNLLIFAAPLFAFQLTPSVLANSLLGFVLFCGLSSSFYLFNDIADVQADRVHPIKCQRPIAAGLVKLPVAIALALGLLLGTLTFGWFHSPNLGLTLTAYALLQVAYNLKLKHWAIWDIIAIALGFVLRACAGGAATGLYISSWLLLCTAMLALFLAVEKRKAELRLMSRHGKTRAVLQHYSFSLLKRMESTLTTSAFLSYAIWSSGPLVGGAATPWMLVTLPWVLYGIFRYQMLSDPAILARRHEKDAILLNQNERPEDVLLSDLPILITVIGWVLTSALILGLHSRGIL